MMYSEVSVCELHASLWLLPQPPAEEAECDQTGPSLVSGQAGIRKLLTAAGRHGHKKPPSGCH